MKICYNCKGINRDNDKFCRNCGILMKRSVYYVVINIFTVLAILVLIFVVILFVASYFAY